LVKFALHSHGYTVDNAIPRTALDPTAVSYTEQNKVGWIPKQSFNIMREKFGEIYPELAKSEHKTHSPNCHLDAADMSQSRWHTPACAGTATRPTATL
jgi:hypothetical protein